MLTLFVGNKNYSSWSLRPWLAMKMAAVAFDEVRIPLYEEGSKETILRVSPSGKVPCLVDRARGGLVVWDSLAICEYVNEQYADGSLWPRDPVARARARSASAEMHAGFPALRQHLSMDIRADRREEGVGRSRRSDVAAEIQRVFALWEDALASSGGPFLYGEFSIADAFYAPVITRFATYGVALPPSTGPWAARVLDLPPMRQWIAAAKAETEVIRF